MSDPDTSAADVTASALADSDAPPVARQRCGFVAVIGAPNAGKSTLVNTIVGTTVSIVSRKVQTTRNRVMGIQVVDDSQLIFIDTPGIAPPEDLPARRLEQAMLDAAWEALQDVDTILLVVDATRGRVNRATHKIIAGLQERGLNAVLVLNKIDRLPLARRPQLLSLTEELNREGIFTDTFMISAEKERGVDDLVSYLAQRMPRTPWHFPADQVSDVPMQIMAAEITREKLFDRLHDELPYSLAVETEAWQEREDGTLEIAQVIYVLREGQKGIVVGKNGEQLKAVGTAARQDIEALLECPVHLSLFCKVKADWVDDPALYRTAVGLSFDG